MKNLTLCLCLLLLFLFSQPALAVSAQLPIMLDGINISAPDYPADNQPAILAQEHSGTAYVPLRFIAELFNAEVSWQEQKIIISNGSNTIKIQLGSQQAVCNNESITLSGAPYEYQNTTYVPFRAVTEALRPDAQGIYFFQHFFFQLGIVRVGVMTSQIPEQGLLCQQGRFIKGSPDAHADNDGRAGIGSCSFHRF